MEEQWSSPSNIVIDTGPLLLPFTREPGWDKVRKLLAMHEKGGVTLHVGLFNVAELVSAMRRLGYDMETTLRYAALVSERLSIVRDSQYAVWMGRLRAEAHKRGASIPWGDISSAAALSLGIPVLVLNEDKHFDQIVAICSELGSAIQVIHVGDLKY